MASVPRPGALSFDPLFWSSCQLVTYVETLSKELGFKGIPHLVFVVACSLQPCSPGDPGICIHPAV
ncbi:hypothetical protein OIU79_015369 [Salix purpurea]|uniref:Uncharacterized protein n=1 Tax=Salix purpurea TaxID=77065 RepID=A0A9Q0PBX9_SALPP|nr:hypothetical protein OIU79_015369 [Salix purpurea]